MSVLGPQEFHDAAQEASGLANKANDIIDLARKEPMVGIPAVATVGLVFAGLKRVFVGKRGDDWTTRG